MTYTLHFELSDATLDKAYHSVGNKRLALKLGRDAAARKPWGVSNIVVCKDDLTVTTFPIRPFGQDE
jgi:hypothetical protein